jgi:hypothetical protein
MRLVKRDLKEVMKQFIFASKKSTSSGFDKGSLGVFLKKGTDALPNAGASDQQIMHNLVG